MGFPPGLHAKEEGLDVDCIIQSAYQDRSSKHGLFRPGFLSTHFFELSMNVGTRSELSASLTDRRRQGTAGQQGPSIFVLITDSRGIFRSRGTNGMFLSCILTILRIPPSQKAEEEEREIDETPSSPSEPARSRVERPN